MSNLLAANEVSDRIREKNGFVLDVLPASVHECAHVPGALNACVYEVAFAGRVTALIPDRAAEIILSDADSDARGAEMAAEKLRRLGYANVRILAGGLSAWQAAGYPVDGTGKLPPVSPARDGTIAMDIGRSRLSWTGRNLSNSHEGDLRFSDGTLIFRQGQLVGGHAVIDMNSITCRDIIDPALNKVLIDHLKSDDFFDAGFHPLARCEFTEIAMLPTAPAGRPNVQCQADLTIKGITHAISFDAASAPATDGRWILRGHFDLDRTRWQVAYASGKWFRHLGMHLVDDLVSMEVLLVSAA